MAAIVHVEDDNLALIDSSSNLGVVLGLAFVLETEWLDGTPNEEVS